MSQQRLSTYRHVMTVLAAVGWLAALSLALSGLDPGWADLAGIVAGVASALAAIATSTRKVTASFMHGYHAGYHDGSKADCCYPKDCDVLVLSEARTHRVS